MRDVTMPELTYSEPGPQIASFQIRYDWVKNPQNDKVGKRLVLQSADWVNIVALTVNQELVVVRQYRAGVGKITTETPGGIVDPGEEPLQAAKRELLEETGFASEAWQSLGSVDTNPAFLNNRCHHWLAIDARSVCAPKPDEDEDVASACISMEALSHEIRAGSFSHAIAFSALARVPVVWKKLIEAGSLHH